MNSFLSLKRETLGLADQVILAKQTFAFGEQCPQKMTLLTGRTQRETTDVQEEGLRREDQLVRRKKDRI